MCLFHIKYDFWMSAFVTNDVFDGMERMVFPAESL